MDYVSVISRMHLESKSNADELSKLIDKYLIPQELEKKQNAEVSTPYSLRQDMLNAMPSEFWTDESIYKYFELIKFIFSFAKVNIIFFLL